MNELHELIQLLRRNYNHDISVFDHSFLVKTIQKHIKRLQVENLKAYMNRIAEGREEGLRLIASLRNEYSEFYRNALTYALLEYRVLPVLATVAKKEGRKEIRIWSAGCSSGQEPYSLAILLKERLRVQEDEVKFRIFATDISFSALETARLGTYNTSLMSNLPLKVVGRYFSQTGDNFIIDQSVKQCVEFSEYNLLDSGSFCPPSSIFGDFDMVVCCNVLMYYSADIQQLIIRKLIRSMVPSGYIVVGETEQPLFRKSTVSQVFSGAPIFRKRDQIAT